MESRFCNICNKKYASYQSLWNHNKKFHKATKLTNTDNLPSYNDNIPVHKIIFQFITIIFQFITIIFQFIYYKNQYLLYNNIFYYMLYFI